MVERLRERQDSFDVLDVQYLPDYLGECEAGITQSLNRLLDGRATKEQKTDFLTRKDEYEESLVRLGEEEFWYGKITGASQIEMKRRIIEDVVESTVRVRGNAHSRHNRSSFFERRRHSLELTQVHRLIGSLIVGGLASGSTAGVLYATEQLPEDNNGAISLGVGVVAAGLKLIFSRRGRKAISSVLSASAGKAKEMANSGFNKHDVATMTQIYKESKSIKDKDERIHFRYMETAKRIYGPRLREILSDRTLDMELNDMCEVEDFVMTVARNTMEWKYGEYSLDVREIAKEPGMVRKTFEKMSKEQEKAQA